MYLTFIYTAGRKEEKICQNLIQLVRKFTTNSLPSPRFRERAFLAPGRPTRKDEFGRPCLLPTISVSSHQSIWQPLVPWLPLPFRMSVCCRALSFDHSYAWLHAAHAADPRAAAVPGCALLPHLHACCYCYCCRAAAVTPVNPSPPVAMVRMCMLPRPLRFPHT
jgi:hypothetical protein